jgi:hypothetical protein
MNDTLAMESPIGSPRKNLRLGLALGLLALLYIGCVIAFIVLY